MPPAMQHVLARDLVEREQVHRMRDLEAAADRHLVVHEVRAAARFLHAPHADLVGVELAAASSAASRDCDARASPPRMTTMMCEPPEKAGRLPPATGASVKCLISGVTCSMATTSTGMVCACSRDSQRIPL